MKTKKICDKYLMNTYGHFDVAVSSGKGATLKTCDGKKLIDFTSGIGVNSLGYGDKEWSKAVANQAKSLAHTSNLYYNEKTAMLSEALCKKSGFDKVFFGNSGAEANECAIKLARKYSFDKYGADRYNIISLNNSFHGRTMATLTATGQDSFHNYFFPFNEGFKYVDSDDFEKFSASADKKTCAVIIELIQGEGGVIPLDKKYVKAVSDFCCKNDIILIVDEVQTGIGRTGTFFLFEQYGIHPDIVTSAKGLGGGLPIGACLCNKKLADVFTPGTHGTTFGGNPVVCSGALVVIDRMDDSFLKNVRKTGDYLRRELSKISEISEIRGSGMMLGISLKTKNAKDVAANCAKDGLLILTAKDSLRLLPPLVLTKDEADKGISILKKELK